MLGLRRELADRHVFDHAPAQRAHRLVGHGDAPVLSEGLLTPHLQDRAPPPAIAFDAPAAAPPYRASGLVLWPVSTVRCAAAIRRESGAERTPRGTSRN